MALIKHFGLVNLQIMMGVLDSMYPSCPDQTFDDQLGSVQIQFPLCYSWMPCDHGPCSTWIKAMPSSIQLAFELKSNQLIKLPFGGILKQGAINTLSKKNSSSTFNKF